MRQVLPSHHLSDDRNAALVVDPDQVDEAKAVDVELRAGECVLFSDRALHSSRPNAADAPRVAIAARLSPSFVRVRPLFPNHACIPL